MENNAMVSPPRMGIFAPIMGAVIIVFAVLTLLAGLPPAETMVSFVIGIMTLIAFTTAIGLFGWHLLLRPMPANLQATERIAISPLTRSIIALLLTLGTLSIGVAGVWDEIWHSKYGIPFGEDFFWRPHLMLYFSFLTLIGLGAWSWITVMRRGKGTLQQRFRGNPLLGVSFLAGGFTIYAVGADPIWHKLYGRDIAPWSVPHLLILTMILVMGLLAVAYHKTLMPNREWRLGLNFNWRDILIALVWVGALVDYMLIFTIQWYAANPGSRQLEQVSGYPDWLFAIFITFLATLFGTLALHSTRQVGSATLVGLIALGVRFALDNGFEGVRVGTTPMGIILPLMVALDILYAVSIARTGKPPVLWLTAGVIALVFGFVGYPIIASLFPFIPVDVMAVPGRIIASAITAAGTIWLVQTVSELSSYGYQSNAASVSPSTASPDMLSARWVNAAIYTAFAVGLVLFIVTASPPV